MRRLNKKEFLENPIKCFVCYKDLSYQCYIDKFHYATRIQKPETEDMFIFEVADSKNSFKLICG